MRVGRQLPFNVLKKPFPRNKPLRTVAGSLVEAHTKPISFEWCSPSYISANLAFKLHSGWVLTTKLLLQRAYFILCGSRWIAANTRIISTVCLRSQKSELGKSKNSKWFCENCGVGGSVQFNGRGCLCTLSALKARPSRSCRYPRVVSGTFICQQSITLGYSAIRYGKFGGMPCDVSRFRATDFFQSSQDGKTNNFDKTLRVPRCLISFKQLL